MTENKYKKEIAILLEKIEQPDAICIGVAAIGKFIGVIALLICVGLLFCYPLLAIIVGAVVATIHMMMAMIQFMMMAIMMITDMTGIQTMLMV